MKPATHAHARRQVLLGRRLIGILTILLIALGAMDALARPGGGSSFSGRSGSSSSSSSSSGSRSGSSSSTSGSSYRSTSSSTSSSSSGSRSSSWGGSSSTTSSSTSSGGSSYTSTSTSTSGSYSGGGSSYSGSSSGSSPSSDDGSFGKAFLIFVAIGVLGIALVIFFTRRKRNAEWATWQSREDADREWRAKQAEEEARTQRYASIDKALSAIKAHDEAFSYVLFEDFLYALYAEVHAARGEKGGLERLSPYLSTSSVATYGNLPKRKLEAVVIGGMRVDSVEIDDEKIAITAIFTSNVSEHGKKKKKDGTTSDDAEEEKTRAWFMEERWTLTRLLGVKSRPPERARTIGCPNCGAPLDKTVGGKCGYCNTTSAGGANDWYADQIEVLAREERGPMLTGTTEEVGTDLPTVVAKNAKKKLEKLRERDAAFTWPSFIGRVEKTFATFHESWCAQDLTAVRPYLSDNLYELQRYWVNAYKEQKLRNLTKDAKVITVHLAKVMSDKFFDAITVRVFATCIDYTVDANDKVVGGKPNQVREYTEYWTFIRGVGKTGAARADGACPNCGASFSADEGVNMAGTCTHCNVKITSGEFDWVLSRIEQDEVYELAA